MKTELASLSSCPDAQCHSPFPGEIRPPHPASGARLPAHLLGRKEGQSPSQGLLEDLWCCAETRAPVLGISAKMGVLQKAEWARGPGGEGAHSWAGSFDPHVSEAG